MSGTCTILCCCPSSETYTSKVNYNLVTCSLQPLDGTRDIKLGFVAAAASKGLADATRADSPMRETTFPFPVGSWPCLPIASVLHVIWQWKDRSRTVGGGGWKGSGGIYWSPSGSIHVGMNCWVLSDVRQSWGCRRQEMGGVREWVGWCKGVWCDWKRRIIWFYYVCFHYLCLIITNWLLYKCLYVLVNC